MKRVTVALDESDYLALKLLAIKERSTLIAIAKKGIRKFLAESNAYQLKLIQDGDSR